MKKAWQNPIGTIRDVCESDPELSYHPDIAKLYTTDVPDGTVNGATLVSGVWVNPAPPPPAQPQPPAPPPVPEAVTMRQARLALFGAGKLATVNEAIAAMPGVQGEAARIEWEFSSEVRRTQPLVMAMGQVLGMTDVQLDALFIAAATL